MEGLVLHWYNVLGTFSRALTEPIQNITESAGLPPLTALLLGVLGALSPCQITTGLSAFALIGRPTEGGRPVVCGLAYLGGKAIVYALLGLGFVLVGNALSQSAIPVIVTVRRLIGPLMLLVGLALLGVWRWRLTLGLGQTIAARAVDRLDATRPRGAFLLGAAFALAMCPTLFLLFFGILIPLALVSPGGVVYPAIFALGTTLPLLGALALMALGLRQKSRVSGRLPRLLTRVAGVVLLLTGLNDTIIYWVLA